MHHYYRRFRLVKSQKLIRISKMGTGKALKSDHVAAVRALHREGKSQLYIADRIGKSSNAVQNVIVRITEHYRRSRLGSKSNIVSQFRRAIVRNVRRAKNEQVQVRKLVETDNPGEDVSQDQQLLHCTEKITWVRTRKEPRIAEDHKKCCIAFVKRRLARDPKCWRHTVFHDEKR